MNLNRFNFFFILIIRSHYNELTIEGNFSLLEEVVLNKSEQIKRKREEETVDDEDLLLANCVIKNLFILFVLKDKTY
jgi:hypothetical protein